LQKNKLLLQLIRDPTRSQRIFATNKNLIICAQRVQNYDLAVESVAGASYFHVGRLNAAQIQSL
jgi:hypothetical protein